MKRIARMIQAGQPFRFDGQKIIPIQRNKYARFNPQAGFNRGIGAMPHTAGIVNEVPTANGFLCFIPDDVNGPELNAWRNALTREDWKFYGLGLLERWPDPVSGKMLHCYYRSKSAYKRSIAWDEVISIPGFGEDVENRLDYADFYAFDSFRNG